MGAKLAYHLSESQEWYTPVDVIDRVRAVLGDIDLDPCSCAAANEHVRARRFYSKEDSGLTHWWGNASNVFINPPGGRIEGKSVPFLFWRKLMRDMADIGHAIFLAFNISHLQSLQKLGSPSPMSFPLCIPRKRLVFVRGAACSPPHANAIVYVPSEIDRSAQFKEVFSEIGSVKL